MSRQPFLHDLVPLIAAPFQVWSQADGDVQNLDAQGVYLGDTRVLSRAVLTVWGEEGLVEKPAIATSERGDQVCFEYALRLPGPVSDPLVQLTRTRTVTIGGVSEVITLSSSLAEAIELTVRLMLTPDGTPLNLIKAGEPATPVLQREGRSWRWHGQGTIASVQLGEAAVVDDGHSLTASWVLRAAPGQPQSISWSLGAADDSLPFVGVTAPPLPMPALNAGAPDALRRLLARSLADLSGLRMAEPSDPSRTFFAAGAPWFFTLFGRDSLIASRLTLPLGPEFALGTLRALQARRGRVVDIDRAEAPGKILHEVRAVALDLREGTVLPPEYYGTVDATLLWICLLGEVWRDGADEQLVAGFTDGVVAGLGWLADYADPDGDGFIEYFDLSGHGLVNQGWKDSRDSVRWADGRIAKGPIALAEVQGYAHRAALTGAELLERFGRTDEERGRAAGWRAYAAALAVRFREQFWRSDELGPYPAIALDGAKAAVSGVASNMGHLLGTGLLNAAEERIVVDRLMHPTMFSGYGVRTMADTNAAYWPLRYHVGSVWTHDNAVIIEGMLASGFTAEARVLAQALLRVGEGFGYRLPELFSGQSADEVYPPAPYPASCRPQAWAAASAITVAKALGALAAQPGRPYSPPNPR